MAKVTNTTRPPKGLKLGQAFICDAGCATYLDGAQMQYTVMVKVRGDFPDTLAYFDTLEDAQLFADVKSAQVVKAR